MSITDELRKWASVEVPYKYGHQLAAIADRIDAEHEAALLHVHTDLMDASGWIRLPKDADGEYIHFGDVMEWPTTGETFEVVGIGEGTLFYVDGGSEYADWTGASTKRHHHAPTVEDVLREFTDEVWNRCCEGATASDSGIDELVAEYASKLRLAEGEDA